jgi:hypothetical protein
MGVGMMLCADTGVERRRRVRVRDLGVGLSLRRSPIQARAAGPVQVADSLKRAPTSESRCTRISRRSKASTNTRAQQARESSCFAVQRAADANPID